MRSQGEVRFIRLTSRMQLGIAGTIVMATTAWLGAMGLMALTGMQSASERADLLSREAKVVTSESRVKAYRDDLAGIVSDLDRRQQFITQMVEAHIGDLPADKKAGETVSDSSQEAQKTVDKVSLAVPEATALARIEASQLAFVERLTRYADRRSAAAIQSIRRLGLNPIAMVGSANAAEGGPLETLTTSRDGSIDPRFQRLGASLARMDALENSLESLPQVSPAHVAYISSSFGYRVDPFTGGAAFHAGLDFPGPMGSPIYAAARGRISFVGQKQGYGNCIEIDHGNGLMTRYAHLSRFRARVGQEVEAGAMIAAMGSTGRSTGSHLHFEVRVNNRPVNPRPFLEAASNVHNPQIG